MYFFRNFVGIPFPGLLNSTILRFNFSPIFISLAATKLFLKEIDTFFSATEGAFLETPIY